jgi:hypothetical protein
LDPRPRAQTHADIARAAMPPNARGPSLNPASLSNLRDEIDATAALGPLKQTSAQKTSGRQLEQRHEYERLKCTGGPLAIFLCDQCTVRSGVKSSQQRRRFADFAVLPGLTRRDRRRPWSATASIVSHGVV